MRDDDVVYAAQYTPGTRAEFRLTEAFDDSLEQGGRLFRVLVLRRGLQHVFEGFEPFLGFRARGFAILRNRGRLRRI